MTSTKSKIASLALASAAVLALFARCVAFSHIGVDDAAYTFRNPFVATGLGLGNVAEALSNLRHGGIWMPATYVSYMADFSVCRALGAPIMQALHLGNVLLHLANFLLLLCLMRRLDGFRGGRAPWWAALLAALLWAAHPLRVEPVAWIAARKELLWTAFALLGLLCWARRRALPTLAFCALACLSKPTAMCFPLLAMLVGLCSGRGAARPEGRLRALAPYAAMLAMAGATAAIAAYSQTHVAGQSATSLYAVPFAHRLVNALSAAGFYVRATVWPAGLHFDCRAVRSALPLGAAWNLVSLAAACAACLLLALRGRSRRAAAQPAGGDAVRRPSALAFAALWFAVALLPTLGVLGGFGVEAHADRFAYLPSMGVSFLCAAALGRPRRDGSLSGAALPWAASAALAAFAAVSFAQLGHWRDDAAAHRRALACDPAHPRAMVHVADSLCSRRRDFDGGIAMYRRALSLSGEVPEGGFNAADVRARLAYALATRGGRGDLEEVKRLGADVLKDVRLDRRGMMLDALGTAFMREGRGALAAALFRASMDAPDRFWPKASTRRKLEEALGR